MNMNRTTLQYFLILSAVLDFGGALVAPPPPCPTATRGIAKSDEANATIGLGLFRPHQNQEQSRGNDQECNAPRRLSQKLKAIRSVLTSRFFGGKKRFLSVLAAAVLVTGAYPSRVIASSDLTKVVTASIRTSMDAEIRNSMHRDAFLQYNRRAPNNYFEDVSPVGSHFDTTLEATSETSTLLEEMDSQIVDENDLDESDTATVENAAQALAPENELQADGDLMMVNDKMIKTGIRNIAIVGTGATSLLVLNKNVAKRTAGGDEEVDAEYAKIITSEAENNTDDVADFGANSSSLRPLIDPLYVEARKQPKAPQQEATLAAKYAAIESLEERAFQILVDLGMVEVRSAAIVN